VFSSLGWTRQQLLRVSRTSTRTCLRRCAVRIWLSYRRVSCSLDKIIQVPFHVPQSTETKIVDLITDIMQPKIRVSSRIRNGKNVQNGRPPVTPPTAGPTPLTTEAENAQLITEGMASQESSLRTGSLPSPGTGSQPAAGSVKTVPTSGPSINHASYRLKHIQTAIEEGARFLP
jgi:hypothetical protein